MNWLPILLSGFIGFVIGAFVRIVSVPTYTNREMTVGVLLTILWLSCPFVGWFVGHAACDYFLRRAP